MGRAKTPNFLKLPSTKGTSNVQCQESHHYAEMEGLWVCVRPKSFVAVTISGCGEEITAHFCEINTTFNTLLPSLAVPSPCMLSSIGYLRRETQCQCLSVMPICCSGYKCRWLICAVMASVSASCLWCVCMQLVAAGGSLVACAGLGVCGSATGGRWMCREAMTCLGAPKPKKKKQQQRKKNALPALPIQ